MFERLRKLENLHILFWLGKDISWCMEWKIFGLIMIVPTLSLAVFVTVLSRSHRKEMYHNLAVCFWISANSVWMIGEFYDHESFRGDAKYLFFIGIAFIFWYYISEYISPSKNKHGEVTDLTIHP